MTEPGENPTEAAVESKPADPVEEKLAEVEKMKADLQSERDTFTQEKTGMQALQQSIDALTTRISTPAPEPEPELPTDEEFRESGVAGSAQIAGRVTKEALSAYHNATNPRLRSIEQGLFTAEYERVQKEDPKNFDRLKKDIDATLGQYPDYQAGRIETVFYQLRGRAHKKLLEMDRVASQSEPVAEPSPTARQGKAKEPEFDELNTEELGVARGLGVKPEQYFARRYGREMKTPEADNAS